MTSGKAQGALKKGRPGGWSILFDVPEALGAPVAIDFHFKLVFFFFYLTSGKTAKYEGHF